MELLNKFFGNLLLGEKNLLDNRAMQIKGKVESKEKTEKSKEKIMRFISENYQITTNRLSDGVLMPARKASPTWVRFCANRLSLRREAISSETSFGVFNDKDIILSFNAYFIHLCIIYYLLQKVKK